MFLDEEDGKKPSKGPRPLDNMSLTELTDYKAALEAEIVRVDQEVARKKAHHEAASSVFKS